MYSASANADASCVSEKDRREMQDLILRDVDLILRDVDSLQMMIIQLKTRYNTHSTIALLSSEILSEIFTMLTRMYDSPIGWPNILLVCSAWRQTALNCPQLWTSVWVGNNPKYLSAFLDRSGTLPLSVFNSHHARFDSDVSLVLSQMYRIKEVNFTGLFPSSPLPLFLGLGSRAPLLQAFTLKLDSAKKKVELPKTLFAAELAQLHTVSLSFCTMPMSFATMSLKSLTIANYPRSSRRELLVVLESACNLTYLSIVNSFSHNIEDKDVYFPHLTVLQLTHGWNNAEHGVRDFYKHVHYPMTTDALMDLRRLEYFLDLIDIGPAIEDHLPVHQLSISLRGFTYLATFSTQDLTDDMVLGDLKGTSIKLLASRALERLCSGLRYPYLKCLRVKQVDFPVQAWLNIFGQAPLTTIHITNASPKLIEAMQNTQFCSLRTLVLKHWYFYDEMRGLVESVLKNRASHGRILPVLHVIGSEWIGITLAEWLESLQGVVGKIEVIDEVEETLVDDDFLDDFTDSDWEFAMDRNPYLRDEENEIVAQWV